MRDGADPLRAVGVHQDAFIAEAGTKRGGCAELGIHFEDDDVSLDDVWVELESVRLANFIGEDAGVGVVLGEAADVVLQRVKRAGGEDARLTHSAAERFTDAASFSDEIGGAAKRRANRSTQAL